jgi:NADH-quinone oxidoreductase subunit J
MAKIIHAVSFYFFALITVISALVVVSGKNLFRNVLALGLFFFTIGGLYFHLNAHFVAASQILLYVGGVVVLVLFGIMLTPNIADPQEKQSSEQKIPALLIVFSLGGLLLFVFMVTFLVLSTKFIFPQPREIISFAKLIFGNYLIVIELLSLIFLSTIVGVAILTREEKN